MFQTKTLKIGDISYTYSPQSQSPISVHSHGFWCEMNEDLSRSWGYPLRNQTIKQWSAFCNRAKSLLLENGGVGAIHALDWDKDE